MQDSGHDMAFNGIHDKEVRLGLQRLFADMPTTSGQTHQQLTDSMPDPTCSQDSVAAALLQPVGYNKADRFRQICSSFFHDGKCHKLSNGHECRYQHHLDDNLPVSKVPPWAHKHACGMPRCPWMNGPPPREQKKTNKRKRKSVGHGVQASDDVKISGDEHQLPSKKSRRHSTSRADSFHDKTSERRIKTVTTCPHRHPAITEESINGKLLLAPAPAPTPEEIAQWKHNFRHWDQPSRDFTCYGIDYDDHSVSSLPSPEAKRGNHVGAGNEDSPSVCFFWYHGSCGRAKDLRTNYKCNYRHSLNDAAPDYVVPPPGYKHRAPCGLEWCPGDAKDTVRTNETLVINTEDHSDDDNSNAPADATEKDWFLAGLD